MCEFGYCFILINNGIEDVHYGKLVRFLIR